MKVTEMERVIPARWPQFYESAGRITSFENDRDVAVFCKTHQDARILPVTKDTVLRAMFRRTDALREFLIQLQGSFAGAKKDEIEQFLDRDGDHHYALRKMLAVVLDADLRKVLDSDQGPASTKASPPSEVPRTCFPETNDGPAPAGDEEGVL